MYLHNKYYKWYKNIVETAKNRPIPNCYTERHHIIPKSLGGLNEKENIVQLTAKEHFICHLLLPKFTKGKDKEKMNYALWMMIHASNKFHDRYRINARSYEIIKLNLQETFSKQHKNRQKSVEHRQKISKTRKKLFDEGLLNIKVYDTTREKLSRNRLGKKLSDDTKNKIGQAHKGKKISSQQKETLSKLNSGKSRSENTKNKISKTTKEQYASGDRKPIKGMLGKKLSEEAKAKMRKPKARGICPHCAKEGAMNYLTRYHFDKCEFKGVER